MSENTPEDPTPVEDETPVEPDVVESYNEPENDYAVFERGDQTVSGSNPVTTEMRAHSWNNGYGVIRSDVDGNWKTSLRKTS